MIGWIIGVIVIVIILVVIIRNLIKTKNQPRMIRAGGGQSGAVSDFFQRCCGRGRY